jgi:hypothetical protein
MTGERALHCARCGELSEGVSANCPHYGVLRDGSRSARAAGVTFVLNEVGASPLTEISPRSSGRATPCTTSKSCVS